MKIWKPLLWSAAFWSLAVAPLTAAPYGLGTGYNFSVFGFTNLATSYRPPLPAVTPPPPTPTASALQTSSCLYNSCGGDAPGATGNTTPTIASSFTVTPMSNQAAFYGVTRYSVFGMYNFRPGAFGATQQPVFSGGLTSSRVLHDPLANPEPGTIALFAAGLLAIGWERRRRRLSRKA